MSEPSIADKFKDAMEQPDECPCLGCTLRRRLAEQPNKPLIVQGLIVPPEVLKSLFGPPPAETKAVPKHPEPRLSKLRRVIAWIKRQLFS